MRVKWIWMMREIGNFYQNANERKMGTCGRFDRMKAPNDRKFSSYFAKFFENKKKKRAENARKSQKQKAKRKRFFLPFGSVYFLSVWVLLLLLVLVDDQLDRKQPTDSLDSRKLAKNVYFYILAWCLRHSCSHEESGIRKKCMCGCLFPLRIFCIRNMQRVYISVAVVLANAMFVLFWHNGRTIRHRFSELLLRVNGLYAY